MSEDWQAEKLVGTRWKVQPRAFFLTEKLPYGSHFFFFFFFFKFSGTARGVVNPGCIPPKNGSH